MISKHLFVLLASLFVVMIGLGISMSAVEGWALRGQARTMKETPRLQNMT